MSRFNKGSVPQVGPRSAIRTVTNEYGTPVRVQTHEGYQGYERDAKSELFLLAASFMGGDDNFYEKESDRYNRLINLIKEREVCEDLGWIYEFVSWLRNDAQMRTVSMVIAVETVSIRLALSLIDPVLTSGEGLDSWITNRNLINVACSRADEPAEVLAYWLSKHGKPIPQPIKNGVADAATRLYNEYSYLKYGNRTGSAVSMRDVLRMTHPTPKAPWQDCLFEWITHENIAIRHNLPMIHARSQLMTLPNDIRKSYINDSQISHKFKEAGMTWEVLSEWSPEGMTGRMWDTIIPSMGYMALLRNLRNFDQAGISRKNVKYVADKLADYEEVAKSRQLPYRFYSTFRAVESVRWGSALDSALTFSLKNIPRLSGNTLVLVDMSGSMDQGKVSAKSDITYADIAKLFGSAWKLSNVDGVDLFQYGSQFENRRFRAYYGSSLPSWDGVSKEIQIGKGGSVLRAMEKFHGMGGTETHEAIDEVLRTRSKKKKYDRLVLITDEQSWHSNYDDLPVPNGMPVYIWNLAGYQAGTSYSGNYQRHTFGGLSDSSFKLIPILESGKNSGWPWDH